jgi:hypothetical protein
LMIGGIVAIKTRPQDSEAPASAPTTSGTIVQGVSAVTCRNDEMICTGFDDLPVAAGVSDFYIGPESLGEPTIDLSLFDTLTRCTTLSPDAKTCTKIEGVSGVSLVSYPADEVVMLDTLQTLTNADVGTTFADLTPLQYAQMWGPTQGSGPIESTTIRGHDAIAYLNEIRPALVWEERPGVLVWVSVPAELEPQLKSIAEGIRRRAGPRTIPAKIVAAGFAIPYDAQDNDGDNLLIGRSGNTECVGFGFITSCEQGVAARTFIDEHDPSEIRVSGWVPANITSVRILAPDGSNVTDETKSVGGLTGRYFATTLTPAVSPVAIEWLDSEGNVVDRAVRIPLDPVQRGDLYTRFVPWDFGFQDMPSRAMTVDTAGPPTS